MIKTVKINEFPDNKELTAYQKSKKILTPEYIYIPLFDNNIEYQYLVEINEKVKVGQVVAKSKNMIFHIIHLYQVKLNQLNVKCGQHTIKW